MVRPFMVSPCGRWFIFYNEENVTCSHCNGILQYPIQFTDTLHRYCLWCIYTREDEVLLHPPSCNLCTEQGYDQSVNCLLRTRAKSTRQLLLDKELVIDHAMRALIESLQVQCVTCQAVLQYSERQGHAH